MRLIFISLLGVLLLSACGDGRGSVRTLAPEPELIDFHLVDSNGHDSAYGGSRGLILDPDINDGLFEVYWHVDSFDDYWVSISVNDAAHPHGAVVLSSELCGPGRACDEGGLQICEYRSDFRMGCGIDLREVHNNQADISGLLDHIPEIVFINLEVCDYRRYRCTTDSIAVEVL